MSPTTSQATCSTLALTMPDLPVKCRFQAKWDHQEIMCSSSVPLPNHGLASLGHTVTACPQLSLRAGGLRSGKEGKFLELVPYSTRGICFSRLRWKGPEPPTKAGYTYHQILLWWYGVLAWVRNSIIWLTQERETGVISHTQLPNKVEKNAENLIFKNWR